MIFQFLHYYGQVTATFSNFLFVFLISLSLTSEPDSLDVEDTATSCKKRKISKQAQLTFFQKHAVKAKVCK